MLIEEITPNKRKASENSTHQKSTLKVNGVKQMTSFNFLYNPLKEANLQEYLDGKINEFNSKSIDLHPIELFTPNKNHLKFKLKVKKSSVKSKSSRNNYLDSLSPQKQPDSKDQSIKLSPKNHQYFLQHKSKTSYAQNFGYFKHVSMQNTLSLLRNRNSEQVILASPLKKELLKSLNKASPLKSSPQFVSKKKKHIRILENNKVKIPESNEERTCLTPNNFLISRKKLGERGSSINKFTISDKEDSDIIKKFRKTMRENRSIYSQKRNMPRPIQNLKEVQKVQTSEIKEEDTAEKVEKQEKVQKKAEKITRQDRQVSVYNIEPWESSQFNPQVELN